MKRAVTLAAVYVVLAAVTWLAADPIRIQVPTYGAGAAPPAPSAGDSPLLVAMATALARIEGRLVAIEAKLNGGATAPPADTGTKPPAAGGGPDAKRGAQVIARSCVECHIAKAAEKKGGGFVIVEDDGKMALLGAEAVDRIKRRVKNRTMPPRDHAPLTETEISDLILVVEQSGPQPEPLKKE